MLQNILDMKRLFLSSSQGEDLCGKDHTAWGLGTGCVMTRSEAFMGWNFLGMGLQNVKTTEMDKGYL